MTGDGRDALLRRLLDGLSEADKARFVRGVTLGALAGAALAGSVLRARRARRRPRPVLRVDAPEAMTAQPTMAADARGAPTMDSAPTTDSAADAVDGAPGHPDPNADRSRKTLQR